MSSTDNLYIDYVIYNCNYPKIKPGEDRPLNTDPCNYHEDGWHILAVYIFILGLIASFVAIPFFYKKSFKT